jgi:hypothetical protein
MTSLNNLDFFVASQPIENLGPLLWDLFSRGGFHGDSLHWNAKVNNAEAAPVISTVPAP